MPQMSSAGPLLGQQMLVGIMLLTLGGVWEGGAWDGPWGNAGVPRLSDQNLP